MYILIICGILGLVISTVLSYILYNDKNAGEGVYTSENEEVEPEIAPGTVVSPMTGKLLDLSETPDDVFASGAMSNGAAIEPIEGIVFAPSDGEITTFFPTSQLSVSRHPMELKS